jgi:hypothetical protein
MVDMMLIVTFIPFFYIFAAGYRYASRLCAISGLAVTGIAIVLSTIPPPEAASAGIFELKVVGGLGFLVLTGLLVFRRYQRSRFVSSASRSEN